jgi:protein-disulfide isomerase/uncharacterized membrane protein
MNKKKGLTLNGLSIANAINLVCSLVIIGVCIYLTSYFFDSHFPSGITGKKSLCDVSNFFTCSGATLSPASNIYGVPVAFFGIIVGLSFLFGIIFPSPEMERTNAFMARVNLPGILLFLGYSIFSLGTLCPMCTAYYVLSFTVFFLYWKYGLTEWTKPSVKVLVVLVILTAIGSFFLSKHYKDKKLKAVAVEKDLTNQFYGLKDYGNPKLVSPYNLKVATPSFNDAPIRLSVFSDFECPYCSQVSDKLHEMFDSPEFKSKYVGKININYYFYPLDDACNPGIKRKFHNFACKAAMIAGCDPEKFNAIHDYIFDNQEDLSDNFLKNVQVKFGLKDCFTNKEVANFIGKSIRQGDDFGLTSTPTLIINGKKIEGMLSNNEMFAIFDALLKEQKK